jgi:hypothetical protein
MIIGNDRPTTKNGKGRVFRFFFAGHACRGKLLLLLIVGANVFYRLKV